MLQDRTHKSYWKQNTSVLLFTSRILQIVIHFWAFLLFCGLVSNIFTFIFRDLEVCLERCDLYGDFGYLNESNIFIMRELCKITHCPFIGTLALLLLVASSLGLAKACLILDRTQFITAGITMVPFYLHWFKYFVFRAFQSFEQCR